MQDATWFALAAVLTVVGGAWTFYAMKNRGAGSGIHGLGLTLIPVAAYLTGLLKVATRITDAVVDWGTALVFSPKVWTGVIVFGLAFLLMAIGRVMGRRGAGAKQAAPGDAPKEVGAAPPRSTPPAQLDDDMADIEAILKKRGIS